MDALKTAAFCGHEEAVRTLFDYTPQARAPRLFPDSYPSELLLLAAIKRHMDVLATLLERIRSLFHTKEPEVNEPGLLSLQLEEAARLASREKFEDAARLLRDLSASLRRKQKQDAVTISG